MMAILFTSQRVKVRCPEKANKLNHSLTQSVKVALQSTMKNACLNPSRYSEADLIVSDREKDTKALRNAFLKSQ